MKSQSAKSEHSFKRSLQIVVLLVVVMIIAAALVVGYGWSRWTSVPEYWQANEQFQKSHTASQLTILADSAFNKWVSEFTAPIPGDLVDYPNRNSFSASSGAKNRLSARTVHVAISAVNAWLSVRFAKWLANQGIKLPKQISGFMVWQENNNPVVAFKISTPKMEQVISLSFALKFHADGKVSINTLSLRGGMLPLPFDKVAQQMRRRFSDHKKQVNKILEFLQGKPFEPVLVLDSRQARLVDFKTDKDGFDLTIVHEPAADHN